MGTETESHTETGDSLNFRPEDEVNNSDNAEKADGSLNGGSDESNVADCAESEETKSFDIAGVCTIKFNSRKLHRLYFEPTKHFLEQLLRESSEDLSQLFCVDTARMENSMPLQQFYNSVNNSSLLEEACESSSTKVRKSCFNCLGDHHMNDCTQPIDRKAVAKNRRELQSKQIGSNSRFFEDEDRSVRFTPGKWSKRLLEAMSVREHEIPPFVYRMRVLGYPPGWLSEAEETSSGLKLFDGSGNEVQDQSGDEDGLVDDEPKVYYNPDKIIRVPGFNVDIQPGMVDEAWLIGMPPIQPHQSRALAIASMKQMQSRDSKPRKLRLPPPKNSLDKEGSLETTSNKRSAEDSNQSEKNLDEFLPPPAKISKTEESGSEEPSTASAPSPMETLVGTPIPQPISHIDSLPSAEKWSQGVADHIPYENLPGATGTFEKMRGVLLKIKDLKKTD